MQQEGKYLNVRSSIGPLVLLIGLVTLQGLPLIVISYVSYTATATIEPRVKLLLYVNSDDGAKTAWTRVGTNPYLNAIDYNVNYAYSSGNNKAGGDFGFADSGKSTEILIVVTVQLYARQDLAGYDLEVFVWDGSAMQSLGTQIIPTSWGWVNWTATATLDTWAKIDACLLRLNARSNKGTFYVDCARLEIEYAYG